MGFPDNLHVWDVSLMKQKSDVLLYAKTVYILLVIEISLTFFFKPEFCFPSIYKSLSLLPSINP